jgi:hypothetical protein
MFCTEWSPNHEALPHPWRVPDWRCSVKIFWTSARWNTEMVRKDRRSFIFGDNLQGWGRAGQACIRGLPNAFGVPTKIKPTMGLDAFFTDEDFALNTVRIDAALRQIPRDRDVVVSKEIGRGLAQLDNRAPRTYAYLIQAIEKLGDTEEV